RPFNYTGANQQEHFLIPKIVKHFKEKKRTIELGNLEISREFNDIDYVCEVYKRLLESSLSSEVFNIASNRGIKLLDVIDMMNELSGYKIEVKINQDFVRKGEIKNLTGSCEKLFKAIGEVEQKPFKQTLQEMLDA
ncbi:MAG: GDP-mannose 4,6-dehydratase, partial [Sulfurimonas sp.]|nr:GDP-mannose 4,6-dehydratase [Sulfurimonas sp.]